MKRKSSSGRGRFVLPQAQLFGHSRCVENLLMLIPEQVRRQVARIIWWDLPDFLHRKCLYVKKLAEIQRPDGEPEYTDDDLYQALRVVGYPEGCARWRVMRHAENLKSVRVYHKPTERDHVAEQNPFYIPEVTRS